MASLATKFLSFFLVPLYTNILSTVEYGISDMFSTTISILVLILTLNIQESVMRFSLENQYDKVDILTVGFRIVFFSIVCVCVALSINHFFSIQADFEKYSFFYCCILFTNDIRHHVVLYSRH